MRDRDDVRLSGARVLDGGLATELERRGVSIAGPLWSARALLDTPEAVLAVHRSYLEAGADVLLTAGYQISSLGFRALGLPVAEAEQAAAGALRQAVTLAVQARADHGREGVLVAASLGPYGAALANGAEFHGRYGFASKVEEHAALVRFHAARIEVLAGTEADLLAFETLPSLGEAQAIAAALTGWSDRFPSSRFSRVGAWLSFTCRDGEHVAHGELLRECAAFLEGVPQILAAGVNCTAPTLMLPLIEELRAGTRKPLVVYPNSGEGWDAERRCWVPAAGGAASFGGLAREWFSAGAQVVGGCCRTGPAEIEAVRKIADAIV